MQRLIPGGAVRHLAGRRAAGDDFHGTPPLHGHFQHHLPSASVVGGLKSDKKSNQNMMLVLFLDAVPAGDY